MKYNLYKSNELDTARFILGKDGSKKLFVIGLNPSTANKEKSDTTVAKVEKVAAANGFDGFVMANLYPVRSTDPHCLPTIKNDFLFQSNINSIRELAKSEKSPVFWAAWGGDITLRPYLTESFKMLNALVTDLNGSWVNYGELRKDGHPRHPSRLSYSWAFSEFDILNYSKQLLG